MHPYIATLSELPGYIAIIANDRNRAGAIIREWYKTRFYRLPEPYHCHIDGVHVAWVRDHDDLFALADADLPGVAYWTPEGWITLPPDVEAAGPTYRAPQATHAYAFSGSREDGKTILFASNKKDAWAIYRVWADLHGREKERIFRIETLTPGVGVLRSNRLAKAMELGITGVASKRLAGWDVLPPWDECAGDN